MKFDLGISSFGASLMSCGRSKLIFPLQYKKGPCGLFLYGAMLIFSQLSTISAPYLVFYSSSVLWLPPLVSTTSPTCGFL